MGKSLWYEYMYQHQFNCAIRCATTGCGVSYKDNLMNADPYIASF
jgi:hypothetical protein